MQVSLTGKEKIVVIEDDLRVTKVMKGLFPLLKINAFFANNGVDGIRLIKEQIPDLIICDIMLPDMQGYEIVSAIKGDAKTYKIPFVFLSAFAEPSDIRKGMDSGADDYLTKPFTSSTLLKTIEARLAIKKKNEQIDFTLENDKWLSVFSGSFNHEFMTPLNGIMGAVELMKQKNNIVDPNFLEELVKTIYSSGYRLMRNTKKIVIYNYFNSARKTEANLQIIPNIDLMLKDSINQLKRQYFEKSTEINYTISASNCDVLGYYEYIKYLFDELLENAYKFNTETADINIILREENMNEFIFEISNQTALNTLDFNLNLIKPFKKFHPNLDMSGLGIGLSNCIAVCDFLSYDFALENIDGCVKISISMNSINK